MPPTGARLRIGSVFAGDFRVLGVLDEGGMGEVYRVEQLSTRCERALKVLKPRLRRDARSVDRFAREAVVGSSVPSEHVVKVLGAGVDDDSGIPWIAMELLEGETLRSLLEREGPLDAARALAILRPLCHALAAAHGVGVVHRDLKPDNIFVAQQRSAQGPHTIKLLDFGLAKVLEEFETARQSTVILGSPLWMAPEQVRREKITPATDVWALGLVTFWLLTGRYYWRSANAEGTAPIESLLHEKLYEPLESASRRARSLGVREALPHGFDEWFRRCVVREPEQRFADAEAAFAVLARVLVRAELGLGPASRRPLYALGALALATLLGGLAWRRYAPRAPTQAPAPPPPAPVPPPPTRIAVPVVTLAPAPPAPPEAPPPTPAPAPPSVPATPATPPPAPPRSPAHGPLPVAAPSPPAEASPAGARGRTVPVAAGFTILPRPAWSNQCTRAAPGAWRVTADALDAEQTRFEQEARNLRAEEAMAARVGDPAQQAEMLARVRRSREQLAQRREDFALRAEQTLRESRPQWVRAAESNHCMDRGVVRGHDEPPYAVWCCP